jgi:integrase
MPKPLPIYCIRQVTRHGKIVHYFWRKPAKRVRLHAEFGSPEFWEQYTAALKGDDVAQGPHAPKSGSLAWLYAQYRKSSAWLTELSQATRRQRENIFKHVIEAGGNEPYAAVTRAHIVAGREKRAKTPAQARNFLDAMRGLFRWALEAEYVKIDPTAGVNNPKRVAGEGFKAWTEDDVLAYEKRWPLGTRQRVWFDVLLYTGLRRGDAVRVGKQHLRNGTITIRTEKTDTIVTLPILPVLQRTLDAGPVGDLTYIIGQLGKPITKEAFGNFFREACDAAGVKKSAHGLRKIAATRAANNGATVAELEAIFGWSGGGMASLYTKLADRERLSRGAMGKLGGGNGTGS